MYKGVERILFFGLIINTDNHLNVGLFAMSISKNWNNILQVSPRLPIVQYMPPRGVARCVTCSCVHIYTTCGIGSRVRVYKLCPAKRVDLGS